MTDAPRDPADEDAVRVLKRAQLLERLPRAHLLSNGRHATMITNAGSGWSACRGLALTRWNGDPIEDGDGTFVYLRDLDSGSFWSIGHQPVGGAPRHYEARFGIDHAEIARLDDGIETRMEVCVSPDDDLEMRRCMVHNTSDRTRRIELTSYLEVVLADAAADAAHPAFSKLFVQTEALVGERALVASRRPRGANERSSWLIHWLIGAPTAPHAFQYETDRQRFIGRAGSLARPQAVTRGELLSATDGNVLDPIFSLRTVLELPPGVRRTVTFGLGSAGTRKDALELASRHAAEDAVADVFGAARRHARDELERLSITPSHARNLLEMTSALLYGEDRARAVRGAGATSLARASLGRLGITGRRPLVLGEITSRDHLDFAGALATAQAFWQGRGLTVDLLLLIDDALAGHAAIQDLGAAPGSARAGTLIVLRMSETNGEERAGLEALAHVVLCDAWPDRVPDTAGDGDLVEDVALYRPAFELQAPDEARIRSPAADQLSFDNGYGGFTDGGGEYLMYLSASRRPPLPWTHVVANESFGFIASESGACFTWSQNSRLNRITPWSNDPVTDPHGEALYVRDEEAGIFWSPMPGPVGASAPYELRYGFGYCRFTHTSADLEQEVRLLVPRRDPLKITRLKLRNLSGRPRRLSVFAYSRLVLGGAPAETARSVETREDPKTGMLLASNPLRGEFSERVAFAAAVPAREDDRVHFTADRASFIGRNGSPARPAALMRTSVLDRKTGTGLDPCAALQITMELAPGETVECAFLLGEANGEPSARALADQYRAFSAIDRAYDEVGAFWQNLVSTLQIRTPAPAIDLMFNGWLGYQTLCCRLWARSAYYQSGGAFGFRDQLQDAAALIHLLPDLTREQILLHAAHQFVEGDVLHWWHPPASRGVRTRFADDLLWLPLVTAHYVESTGERAILDEEVRFLEARRLEEGEDEAYLLPVDSGQRASLYEHCCRALDRSLTQGAHGLPLMGTGDWNDGMNRVGREGRGESVWLGFFLYDILGRFAPICRERGDERRAQAYEAHRAHLLEAVNDAGWDGGWYRRAYYDDGTPLGSAQNDECRIDALAQAWAVISGAAPPERAEQALDALEAHLVSEREGLIRLLTPPFDRTDHDPGYIKGYVPGVRENGGQYTHAALWAVSALAKAGRATRAAALLEMLSPVSHARTPEEVMRYKVEPYVIAADVYGVAPHVGRGGWTWYTGSAGWMYRVILESLLGCRLENGTTLAFKPRLPASWPECELRYGFAGDGTSYLVRLRNGPGASGRVRAATLDGTSIEVADGVARFPIRRDGACHEVLLELS